MASRRYPPGAVALVGQVLALGAACLALTFFPGHGPSATALAWGALSGVGSAGGTLALYHGMSTSRMSVVATVSAVLTAVIPAIVGLALGERLGATTFVGIAIAIPAIALVSWQPRLRRNTSTNAGIVLGALAGAGFAMLFVALDRAGRDAGAWPLVPGQAICLLLVLPFAREALATGIPSRSTLLMMVVLLVSLEVPPICCSSGRHNAAN